MTERRADDLGAVRVSWVDPAALFARGAAREHHCFWLDAGPAAHEGWSHLGVGTPAPPPLATVLGGGHGSLPGRFEGGWVGWFGYDGAAARAGAPAVVDGGAPDTAGLVVSWFVSFDHARQEAWLVAPGAAREDAAAQLERWVSSDPIAPAPIPPRAATARVTAARYAELIESCRDAIRVGDAYQLCLTTRFTVEAGEPIDPAATYLRLRETLPAHHGGIVRVGAHALLSGSPERFLEVRGATVRTHPIKGTRPRSADSAVDARAAVELAASIKERAENVMIVDLMRNDLQRVCHAGSVAAERLLEVESYSAVHQLVSTVAGRLREGTTLADLLDAAFPAGSMTGAPKLSAMAILHTLEAQPRGIYAGCFGWIGDDGDLDLAMTIRSIVVHPRGAYVGAGGGITWLSDPADEVAEVGLKARGPLAALGAATPVGW